MISIGAPLRPAMIVAASISALPPVAPAEESCLAQPFQPPTDPPGRGPESTAKGGTSDADALRRRIKSLLSADRIDEAVRVAQAALREAPENASIRREFVELHLSLARGWLAEERFGDAEIALDAVLRAHEGQSDAVRLKQSIDSAWDDPPADPTHLPYF